MANALSVLEREEEKQKLTVEESDYSRIKRNYAMLINPELKADDLLGKKYEEQAAAQARALQTRQMQMQAMQEQIQAMKAQPAQVENNVALPVKPYLVENARADSILFRADSPVNSRAQTLHLMQEETEDEDNEDLRPTATTIQYKTANTQKTVEEGVLQNTNVEKHSILSKREKIIIGVVISVFVALFALIIINSAIISNISNDIRSLQSSLAAVEQEMEEVNEEYNSFMSDIEQIVDDYATANGMVKK